MWKNVYFLALDSSKRDEKTAKGNGKRPSVQDSNGEAKSCYNRCPLMCEIRGVSAMMEIHYK
jgi:hypothetical protein